MPYTYRNRNTGDVYTLSERDPRLDSLPNWERFEDVPLSDRDRLALERAAAERALIDASYQTRLAQVKATAAGKVAATEAEAAAASAAPLAIVRTSPAAVERTAPATYGPRTVTPEEAAAQAAADAANPPTTSVLARAVADQRGGAVQTGDNPTVHPVGRAALEAKADADAANPLGRVLERDTEVVRPARNAKRDDWAAYAIAVGADEAEVAGLFRDDLIARFGE